jgi:muconate cycloisomerase
MARITSFHLYSVDLPFRRPFKHAAYERYASDSIFLKCVTDAGHAGFGESLPREYVTGESRDSAYEMLRDRILPPMVGKSFDSYEEVKAFLCECDGKAPSDWAAPDEHQTSAWCAVDLSLLDAFGHAFKQPVFDGSSKADISGLRYSAVISSDRGMKLLKNVLKILLFGMDRVKLKVDGKADGDMYPIKILRGIPGRNMDIRVDANMAWTREQAVARMGEFAKYGVRFFEQPVSNEA